MALAGCPATMSSVRVGARTGPCPGRRHRCIERVLSCDKPPVGHGVPGPFIEDPSSGGPPPRRQSEGRAEPGRNRHHAGPRTLLFTGVGSLPAGDEHGDEERKSVGSLLIAATASTTTLNSAGRRPLRRIATPAVSMSTTREDMPKRLPGSIWKNALSGWRGARLFA